MNYVVRRTQLRTNITLIQILFGLILKCKDNSKTNTPVHNYFFLIRCLQVCARLKTCKWTHPVTRLLSQHFIHSLSSDRTQYFKIYAANCRTSGFFKSDSLLLLTTTNLFYECLVYDLFTQEREPVNNKYIITVKVAVIEI